VLVYSRRWPDYPVETAAHVVQDCHTVDVAALARLVRQKHVDQPPDLLDHVVSDGPKHGTEELVVDDPLLDFAKAAFCPKAPRGVSVV
jgi:hypothetical protein